MPREIITIQVGQCGNQIGMNFWELALKEHATKGLLFDDAMSSFFRNDNSDIYNPSLKARALVVDTEEGVINQLKKSDISNLFDTKNFIQGGVSGAGNNWAHGFFEYGSIYKESIINNIYKLVEESDSPQCFMFTHSIGGGTGSGLGTFIINQVGEYFPDLFKFSVSVFPSEDDDVITSPYNTMLSLNELINCADCVMPIDNQSLMDICDRVDKESKSEKDKSLFPKNSKNILDSGTVTKIIGGKLVTVSKNKKQEENSQLESFNLQEVNNFNKKIKLKEKPYTKMNSIIAHLLSNFTCSMRFEGSLNVDINDITMNLVPFPRLHFLSSSISPLYHVLDKKLEPRRISQIFGDIFHKNFQLITMNNYYNGINLANALIARGDLSLSDINVNLSKQKDKIKMVHWNHEGFKIGMCNFPPVNMNYGILNLSNNTAISDCFTSISERFMKLYKVNAHVHHYTEYTSKEIFDNAYYNCEDLIREYNTIGLVKNNTSDIKNKIDVIC